MTADEFYKHCPKDKRGADCKSGASAKVHPSCVGRDRANSFNVNLFGSLKATNSEGEKMIKVRASPHLCCPACLAHLNVDKVRHDLNNMEGDEADALRKRRQRVNESRKKANAVKKTLKMDVEKFGMVFSKNGRKEEDTDGALDEEEGKRAKKAKNVASDEDEEDAGDTNSEGDNTTDSEETDSKDEQALHLLADVGKAAASVTAAVVKAKPGKQSVGAAAEEAATKKAKGGKGKAAATAADGKAKPGKQGVAADDDDEEAAEEAAVKKAKGGKGKAAATAADGKAKPGKQGVAADDDDEEAAEEAAVKKAKGGKSLQ
ncbi:hypothetical protein HYH02_015275 [Chlamydomonas schloesseri]|uniref:Uncharacterized protein n=1 Tax=Chlamydomonas schloesseri TaxID=2026947 RepID=A0A835SAP3_9CHLO|nr:hypothetical protein HYH02_015275 [Chlamydomonas schloesseri]|eukprot:KAG2423802.1 hypothetical protein HYH02_015275 [Chlamydomonas schloesseri]